MAEVRKTIFDVEGVKSMLSSNLNEEMLMAAEPILEEALREMEKEMRKRLSACLIAQIDRTMDVEMSGDILTIRFQRPEK